MPTALYKSSKDSRNHILWQPSDKSLKNLESDEAGKLAAFRERFGRGWDVVDSSSEESLESGEMIGASVVSARGEVEGGNKMAKGGGIETAAVEGAQDTTTTAVEDPFDSLVDLINQYSKEDPNLKGGSTAKQEKDMNKNKKR
jgi:hypothetical protein